MRLIATKPFRYNTRRLKPGDIFEARKSADAKVLIAAKKAKEAFDRDPVDLAPPPSKLAQKIEKIAGPRMTAPADPAMAELRKEYQETVGKKPFPGWDADELRRRMAEAAAES